MDVKKEEMFALTGLWHLAYGHLLGDRRSGVIRRALKEALALFHEDKLAGVLRKVESLELSRSSVYAFCDLPVEDIPVPAPVSAWLRDIGIRFGGELFRFDWERLARKYKHAEPVRVLLIALGFPEGFDAWAYGWRPAYLADPAVRAALSASWAAFDRNMDPWDPNPLLAGHPGGFVKFQHFVGMLIRTLDLREEYSASTTGWWQAKIVHVPELAALHAAMYVPDDWSPPAETCPEWDAYRALEERAKAFAAGHGRPNSTLAGSHVWSIPGAEVRRVALASALREEGMSPHFFDQALFSVSIHGNGGAQFSRASGQRGAKTVRAFLALSRAEMTRRTDFWNEIEQCLKFWGLKLGMTEAELDDLFGPEPVSTGA